MTYCVALNLDAGMIFASDSRTNEGMDQISVCRKMHVFERAGDRVVVMLCAGNLSIVQGAIHLLTADAPKVPGLGSATSMHEVATLAGDALRRVMGREGPQLMAGEREASACFLVGGQIAGERPRLFNVYREGNFIEATAETPYFQIGESKYGKPVIDRVVNRGTGLLDAAKCVLVSFDSTMRSNISVGLPIDLLCYRTDSLRVTVQRLIEHDDDYFAMIHSRWGEGLRRVFSELPDPHWAS